MTKLYLVVSVRELKRLLKAAQASQKLARNAKGKRRDNHCVVLDLETAPGHADINGAEQVSSASFNAAISWLARQS